jgi:HSP20 family protein
MTNIVRYRDPFDVINDSFLTGFFDRYSPSFTSPMTSTLSSVTYESEETEGGMALRVALPGVKASSLSVDVVESTVTLTFKRKGEERTASFKINKLYDASAAKARLEDGILELTIPRTEKASGKRIEVEVVR